LKSPSAWPTASASSRRPADRAGTLDELRAKAGKGHSSLEDTFLTLVAEQAQAA